MGAEDLAARRAAEQARIRLALAGRREVQRGELRGGPGAVAFVAEDLCIGCDQCTIVCDDDAIELYEQAMRSPIMEVASNRKARIVRDACTGCRLCVLACPTDAITMIDR